MTQQIQPCVNLSNSPKYMSMRAPFIVLFLLGTVAGLSGAVGHGSNGIAATVHPLATDAAVAAMRQGGNAVDAAVAAGLTLGVVDGFNSGIGGGCFVLVRSRTGVVAAIDARETAPGAATRTMYHRNGKADTRLSQTGPLAIAIPGALAGYEHACTRFGKLPFKSHLLAAAKIAEEGFILDSNYAGQIEGTVDELRKFPASKAQFFKPDGTAYRSGETLKQPDLAKTYRAIANEGLVWFYGGPFAKWTEAWMRNNGGIVTAEDFRNYKVQLRDPILTTFNGYEILGFPPPSSGGVHVAQILNTLEVLNLRSHQAGSASFVHVVTECMKLAFADRAYWLGDPDFVKVPRGLVSKEYAKGLAGEVKLETASKVAAHNTPPASTTDSFSKHTTHFSTADKEGNWVACTATINTTFGSKVVIPGTGVIMNNEMDDFALDPGAANYFGLVGAEANAVAPGKRPLSSMSPTIVLTHGRPILSLGAAGGPTIISQTVLNLVHVLQFGLSLDVALAQVRFHHQWKPDELKIETTAVDVVDQLRKLGHTPVTVRALGISQAVGWDGHRFLGVSDPRISGKAAGF